MLLLRKKGSKDGNLVDLLALRCLYLYKYTGIRLLYF